MTATELRQYIDANASLPPDAVLGHIAWFEVEDGRYGSDDLELSFATHGLNPAFLPPPINPADAFEKATKEAEGAKYPVVVNGTMSAHAVILVREAARTESQIQRHLIREIRDESARKLSYEKVGEFVYYRPKIISGRVDHTSAAVRSSLEPNIVGDERTLLEGVVQTFDEAFDRYRNYHDGQKLRAVMRGYLLHLNAVLMKSSVYFVHVNRADELRRLQAFTRDFPGLSLTLWQIPDLEEHRHEVVEAFQREAEKDFTEVVKEIQKVRATRERGATQKQWVRIKGMYDAVVSRAGEYQRTLELSQDRTEAAAEVALEALVEFQAEVFKEILA